MHVDIDMFKFISVFKVTFSNVLHNLLVLHAFFLSLFTKPFVIHMKELE